MINYIFCYFKNMFGCYLYSVTKVEIKTIYKSSKYTFYNLYYLRNKYIKQYSAKYILIITILQLNKIYNYNITKD